MEKLKKLKHILKEMQTVNVAFSGGVDSAFLLKVAYDTLKTNARGVLAVSPTYPSREYEKAVDLAKNIGVTLEIIHTYELEDDNFITNPVNRCYFCKSELFEKIAELANSSNFKNMVDGSNADDKNDHRPGMKALREKGVRSPLQEAGITKEEIRILSKEMGLPTWNKEELACLSSRFPYGEKITLEKLKMVDAAENILRDAKFKNIRARHQGKTIKIETAPEDIHLFLQEELRIELISKLKNLGYQYITLDLEGYRRGSQNEVISQNALRKSELIDGKLINPDIVSIAK